jgi:hypothetical protein
MFFFSKRSEHFIISIHSKSEFFESVYFKCELCQSFIKIPNNFFLNSNILKFTPSDQK